MAFYRYFMRVVGRTDLFQGIYQRKITSRKRQRAEKSGETVDPKPENMEDLKSEVFEFLLTSARSQKFDRITENYYDDPDDVKALKEHLPEEYKPYAHDIRLLKEILITREMFRSKIEVVYVISIPPCIGCQSGLSSQYQHMDCPDGCLHDRACCYRCTKHVAST